MLWRYAVLLTFNESDEMRLIFQLGTTRPKGLNINFSFI